MDLPSPYTAIHADDLILIRRLIDFHVNDNATLLGSMFHFLQKTDSLILGSVLHIDSRNLHGL